MKFPLMRDNIKVTKMNMFIMNQNIFKMVQMKKETNSKTGWQYPKKKTTFTLTFTVVAIPLQNRNTRQLCLEIRHKQKGVLHTYNTMF